MNKYEIGLREILGENLRMMRRKQKISQEALGDTSGLHRTYVGSVERGERNVSLSSLASLALALRTTVPRLLTRRTDH